MLTHPEIIGRLSEEDLQRWRVWSAREESIQVNPRNYNRDEIERHYMERLRMWGEFFARYNVAESPHTNIQATSGVIFYMNERQEA